MEHSCIFKYFFPAVHKMPKTILLSIAFYNNVNRIPEIGDIRTALAFGVAKLLGDIGAAQYIWEIDIDSLSLDDRRIVNVSVKLLDPSDIRAARMVACGMGLTRVVGFEKVAVRVVDIS